MPERPPALSKPSARAAFWARARVRGRPDISPLPNYNEGDRDKFRCYGRVMRTARNLARAWSATGIISWSEMSGRLRFVVEAEITPKGAGRHTPFATPLDAATVTLVPLVATHRKDVPAGIRRYGSLMQSSFMVTGDFKGRFGEDTLSNMVLQLEKRTLLEALAICLRTFSSKSGSEIGFVSLNIEKSEYQAKASLYLGDPPEQFITYFVEDPREGSRVDPIVESVRMRGFALTALADLLADNLQTTHENGPSVSADEPLPPDEKTPRGANPETTTGQHPEARRERDKSQVGFESYGDPSGGAPLPPTEPPDEDRPKRYG
jgi:hypothetical protein